MRVEQDARASEVRATWSRESSGRTCRPQRRSRRRGTTRPGQTSRLRFRSHGAARPARVTLTSAFIRTPAASPTIGLATKRWPGRPGSDARLTVASRLASAFSACVGAHDRGRAAYRRDDAGSTVPAQLLRRVNPIERQRDHQRKPSGHLRADPTAARPHPPFAAAVDSPPAQPLARASRTPPSATSTRVRRRRAGRLLRQRCDHPLRLDASLARLDPVRASPDGNERLDTKPLNPRGGTCPRPSVTDHAPHGGRATPRQGGVRKGSLGSRVRVTELHAPVSSSVVRAAAAASAASLAVRARSRPIRRQSIPTSAPSTHPVTETCRFPRISLRCKAETYTPRT